jgi:PIN domain nuclease of toxin-antitoxin system
MRYLLDTHALLWWWTNDPQLSARVRELISDESNTILVSAACAWEIATKHRLGKLAQATEAIYRFNELVVLDGFEHLPMSYLHALRAGGMAGEHRDPFDRMLVAQSQLEGAMLISCDPALAIFGVSIVW